MLFHYYCFYLNHFIMFHCEAHFQLHFMHEKCCIKFYNNCIIYYNIHFFFVQAQSVVCYFSFMSLVHTNSLKVCFMYYFMYVLLM